MEAEKSRDLCASWRPRKAGGVTEFKSEGLRRAGQGMEKGQRQYKSFLDSEDPRARRSDVQGQEKMNIQLKQREKMFSLSQLFCSIQAFGGLRNACHTGDGNPLYLVD